MEAVLAEVDQAFEAEQVPWLEELVNQPSYTNAREDVEAAARIIEKRMLEIGCRVTHVKSEQFADHRVYSTPATGTDDKALLLAGHCDTVYPREQGFLEFRRDGDTIFGPGVLDMKSGLSVIVFSLQAISRAAPEKFSALKLRFVNNTDEEVGSPDSRSLYEQVASKTTEALVFEGGRDGDRIITARKGTAGFQLTVTGRGAHAGNQHADGINAIHALSLIIPRLEAMTNYEEGTTANVGMINGGTSKNTVPEKSECSIDVRITSKAGGEKVVSTFEEIVAQPFSHVAELPEKFNDVSVDLDGGIRRPPMEPTSGSANLRERYEAVAEREGLGIGEAPLQGGGSDANLLAAKGVPCIDGLGPYGKHMHSPKEWSSLESLKKRTRALATFLLIE